MPSTQPASLSLATRRASLRGLYWQGEAGHAPLLLLPGITSPAATLSFFVDVLRRHGLAGHTLILDHRGLGCSRAHGSKIAFQDYVDDVIAWLDHVSFSQPIGVGHSLGAKILAAVDVQASGRIASRILIDPPMSGPGRRPYPYALSFYADQKALSVSDNAAAELARQLPQWSEDRIAERVRWLPTCSDEAIAASLQAFNSLDPVPPLVCCSNPKVLIYGGDSHVFTKADRAELESVDASFEFKKIDGAGHLVPWDQPERLGEFIAQYIRSFEKQSRPESKDGERF